MARSVNLLGKRAGLRAAPLVCLDFFVVLPPIADTPVVSIHLAAVAAGGAWPVAPPRLDKCVFVAGKTNALVAEAGKRWK
jgi:hypothetical protein